MNCPRCKTTQLREITYEGVKIDTCENCQGEWLDAGELKSINDAREVKFSPQEIELVDGIDSSASIKEGELAQDLLCPHCNVEMRQFNYASTSGIVIDKCPTCQGHWLDKSELENIQILVEEWETKLAGDLDTYGPLVDSIKQKRDDLDKEGPSRSSYINALVNKIISW